MRVLRRRERLESKRQPSCLGQPADFTSLKVCSASNEQHDTATPSLTEAYAKRSRLAAGELVTFLGVHDKTSHDVMVRCADGLMLTRAQGIVASCGAAMASLREVFVYVDDITFFFVESDELESLLFPRQRVDASKLALTKEACLDVSWDKLMVGPSHIEGSTQEPLSDESLVLTLLVEHARCILYRCQKGREVKMPFERLHGKKLTQDFVPFREKVLTEQFTADPMNRMTSTEFGLECATTVQNVSVGMQTVCSEHVKYGHRGHQQCDWRNLKTDRR